MRFVPGLLFVTLLSLPHAAAAQSFELYGAAGPTIVDSGNSFAVGAGFSPTSLLTLVFNFERTHLSSRLDRHGDVFSRFRGGTLLLGTGELRVTPFRRDRIGPYGVAGLAAGLWRPNVNELFPQGGDTDGVRAVFLGGGLQVPVGSRLTLFGDYRFMFGAEGPEGLVAVAPLRAGLAWRF